MPAPRAFLSNAALWAHYEDLQPGDLFIGRLNIKPSEEYLFFELQDRGLQAYPPLLAQYLSRSKCFQARVYQAYMVPLTFVVRDEHDLRHGINLYGQNQVAAVVTKQDRSNCGFGIHFWESFESLYRFVTWKREEAASFFPFVVQPFVPEALDIRVVVLGDYQEAYIRNNPHNFRNNLSCGGQARKYRLSREELALCQQVMARGRFPYAHLDFLLTPQGELYLSEINLRGGLKGAQISPTGYRKRLQSLHQAFLEDWLARHPGAQIFS